MAKWDLSKLPEGRKPLPDKWFAERAQMQERIEELEAACWRMKEERDSDKDRAKAGEAKLAKAMQLIYDMFNDLDVEGCGCELCASYLKRLPELTGGKDE